MLVPLIVEAQELCALGNLEVRTMKEYNSEDVDTGDLAEVATLEVAAPLGRTEDPYEMEYCSDQTRVWDQAQIGTAVNLDGRPVEGSYDLVVGTTGDAVSEEGAAVERMAFHN